MTAPAPPASQDWDVFGTRARLVVTEPGLLDRARGAVDAELAAIDLAASRFRQDSEVSAVNRGEGRPVAVSDLFLDLLAAALDAAGDTSGALDPTRGAVQRDLTDDPGWGTVPRSRLRVQIRTRPTWRSVEREGGTVRVPEGVQLDLDATAGAQAADRAATAAYEETGCALLLSLGGDIRVVGPAAWSVAVAGPGSGQPVPARGLVVSITSGGLATSGTPAWQHLAGAQGAHPVAGGRPPGPWRSVSVAAATCLEARVAATAALVLGEQAEAFLLGRALPSRLVSRGGSVRTVAGWPPEGS